MRKFSLDIHDNPLKTREDIQLAYKQIHQPLLEKYSPGFAHLHIGNTGVAYPFSTAKMEGFSRLLWGMAPLLAGGGEYEHWNEIVLQGVKNGTNPEHEEYWGNIQDYDQRIVEMAAFGLALAITPEKIYDPLDNQEKRNLVNWLSQIQTHKAHDCNWLLFSVIVNLGLKRVGKSYDKEQMNRHLDRIEDYYLGNGWYSDGVNAHCDYYTSFAIHYYCLLYAKMMEQEDPTRSERYKDRAKQFAKDFIYWFSKDGSAIPYGRSLTYRFAQASFWSAMVFAEVEAFPMGVMKGLIMRHLRWWFNKPIFLEDGVLSIGYTYPNQVMSENYNSPGSPYWGLKIFLILALDQNHPFWKAEEQQLPKLERHFVQKPAHLVLCRQDQTGHVIAFNTGHQSSNGHTHTSAKYEKFAYSNYFGFSVPRAEWGLDQGAFDSTLAVCEQDNLYRVKRKSEEIQLNERYIYSKWRPWEDVVIETWIVVGAPWHVRIHKINSARKLDVADGGFALGKPSEMYQEDEIFIENNHNGIFIKNKLGACGIKNIDGNGCSKAIHPNANTNIMNPRTVIPTVTARFEKGAHLFINAVYAEPKSQGENWLQAPNVKINSHSVSIFSGEKEELLLHLN
ncbi:DUF2264 domain-containing protein [Bacillus sp. JCM 19034]|uniref:DUF2264 domain-containing protein n=1 Tax=Bacillus sp. JCM 19034 TaxID=1481928 RepID=UPI000781A11E|nr:DUF2264 domain-containing protein [Bacillus sp. JCM 19034]